MCIRDSPKTPYHKSNHVNRMKDTDSSIKEHVKVDKADDHYVSQDEQDEGAERVEVACVVFSHTFAYPRTMVIMFYQSASSKPSTQTSHISQCTVKVPGLFIAPHRVQHTSLQ
eukprot:TRINITY_DN5332_c0_g2_i1.p1 TRINITY_DN5332_c0_g2~~TRINITY_DN5332_c0_g2_i1.p1  ORF type:complete len:128 (+),score=2.64 TRINITY_DN5332_c0_g2_i1:48-386(+)